MMLAIDPTWRVLMYLPAWAVWPMAILVAVYYFQRWKRSHEQ